MVLAQCLSISYSLTSAMERLWVSVFRAMKSYAMGFSVFLSNCYYLSIDLMHFTTFLNNQHDI